MEDGEDCYLVVGVAKGEEEGEVEEEEEEEEGFAAAQRHSYPMSNEIRA